MASNKEAMVIIVDVASSSRHLDVFKDMVCNIISRRVIAQSKDEISLVICGSEDTRNDLYNVDSDDYQHITVVNGLQAPNIKTMCAAVQQLEPSLVERADWVESLVVGMDIIKQQTAGRRGSFTKRVLMFSTLAHSLRDGGGGMDKINAALVKECIRVDVVGCHQNDHGDMSNTQMRNNNLLTHLLDNVPGGVHQQKEAMSALSSYETREVSPRPWTANWQIGNLNIPVAGYNKVRENKPVTMKQCLAEDIDCEPSSVTSYHLNDDAHTEVELADTVRGYRYGGMVVPVGEADEKQMKYATEGKCFTLLGFTNADMIKLHHLIGDNTMVFVSNGDDEDSVAFSAIVGSMYKNNMCAIIRYAYRAGSQVKLGIAFPHIKTKYEGLIFHILPFKEDLRHYMFPTLTGRKDLMPSEQQTSAVDEMIDSMDLTAQDVCGGEPLKSTHIPNPYIQHLFRCIEQRLYDPECPLPDVNTELRELIGFDSVIVNKCRAAQDCVKQHFTFTEQSDKKAAAATSSNTGAAMFKTPLTAVNGQEVAGSSEVGASDKSSLSAELSKHEEIEHISELHPVRDLNVMLSACARRQDGAGVLKAFHQMSDIITSKLMKSLGEDDYTTVTEYMTALRSAAIQYKEGDVYNRFMKEVKLVLYPAGKRALWDKMCREDVLLVQTADVSSEQVAAFSKWGPADTVTSTEDESHLNTDDKPTAAAVPGADQLLEDW